MPPKRKAEQESGRGGNPKLSVLDLCKRGPGQSAREALEQTIELACHAEALGYDRYWIAEHHTDDAAQSSPEVLLPLIAARTRTIPVGAGGVLLPYYSPLKVAEVFLAIAAMFPGRIDLGVCRGPGVTSRETALALVNGRHEELDDGSFGRKTGELAALLRHAHEGSPANTAPRAHPLDVAPPPLWVLGAGPGSMRTAAALGTRYAYSLFFGGGLSHGLEFMKEYFARFSPGPGLERGHGAAAVSVICADTESLANRCNAEFTARGCYESNVVGTPRQCAETLKLFASLFGVDDLIVATFVQNHEERRDLYRQLAEEFYG